MVKVSRHCFSNLGNIISIFVRLHVAYFCMLKFVTLSDYLSNAFQLFVSNLLFRRDVLTIIIR